MFDIIFARSQHQWGVASPIQNHAAVIPDEPCCDPRFVKHLLQLTKGAVIITGRRTCEWICGIWRKETWPSEISMVVDTMMEHIEPLSRNDACPFDAATLQLREGERILIGLSERQAADVEEMVSCRTHGYKVDTHKTFHQAIQYAQTLNRNIVVLGSAGVLGTLFGSSTAASYGVYFKHDVRCVHEWIQSETLSQTASLPDIPPLTVMTDAFLAESEALRRNIHSRLSYHPCTVFFSDELEGSKYAIKMDNVYRDPKNADGDTWRIYTNREQHKKHAFDREVDFQYRHLLRSIVWENSGRDCFDTRFHDERKGTSAAICPDELDFDLSCGIFPLLELKSVPLRWVFEELKWFLGGNPDVRLLQQKGVTIWDDNAKEHGSPLLGPLYGFQWRHHGATYAPAQLTERPIWDYNTYYGGKDQINELLEGLRTDPFGRRHIVSAWNPTDQSNMALPPYHVMFQMFVTTPRPWMSYHKELTCKLTQRSADVGLGLPFNIASYALLTLMVAKATGLRAKRLVVSLGDAHVYKEHFEQLQKLTERDNTTDPERDVYFPPHVRIDDFGPDLLTCKWDEHVHVTNYYPGPKVSLPMVVTSNKRAKTSDDGVMTVE